MSLSFICIISLSINASAYSSEVNELNNELVQVYNSNIEQELKEQYLSEGKIVKDIQIFEIAPQVIPDETINSHTDLKSRSFISCDNVRNLRQGGESWSYNAIQHDYISPGGLIEYEFSKSIQHEYTLSVGAESQQAISAEAGYGYTTSTTVRKMISQANNTNAGMYVDLHIIYKNFTYDLYSCGHFPYGAAQYLGYGNVSIPVGLGIVTY